MADEKGRGNTSDVKKPLTGLFRDDPETPEGKYLVQRRDGTVVEWPSFVLGARDEDAETAFRFYSLLKMVPDDIKHRIVVEMRRRLALWLGSAEAQHRDYGRAVERFADYWAEYRREHGDGDPLMGRHRKDDPATVEKMKQGMSA